MHRGTGSISIVEHDKIIKNGENRWHWCKNIKKFQKVPYKLLWRTLLSKKGETISINSSGKSEQMSWRIITIQNPTQLSLQNKQLLIIQKEEKFTLPVEDFCVIILDSPQIS